MAAARRYWGDTRKGETAPRVETPHLEPKGEHALLTEPLQVGQFAIVDHEPVDRGPNAGIFEGKGPIDERAELFVLAEGTTPAGEAFAGHVVSAIGTAWASFDMSLSGSLTSTFREAERNIWEWNRKSIAQHRVSIGLTCFAHRGSQAVVAQAGPSIAFHLHEGKLHAYFPRGEKAKAIGSGAPPEPHFTRVEFDAGDRLLLLSTSGMDEVDQELIGGILSLPGQQALQDLYQRVRGLRHLTALLVAAPDPPAEQESRPAASAPVDLSPDIVIDATTERPGGFQPSLFIEDEHQAEVEAARNALVSISTRASSRRGPQAPLAQAMVVEPLRRAAGDGATIRDLAERFRERSNGSAARAATTAQQAPGAVEPAAAAAAPRPIWNARQAPAVRNDSQGTNGRTQSFSRRLAAEPPSAAPAAHAVEQAPPVAELAAERTRRLQGATSTTRALDIEGHAVSGNGPLVRPRDSMGGRWKGNGSLSGRRTSTAGGWFNDRTMLLAIVALVVAIGVLLAAPRLWGGEQADPAELLAQAQDEFDASSQSSDPTLRRASLARAESLILEAHTVGGETVESRQLFNQVAGALATLNAVVHPAAVEPIANLSQFGSQPITPSEMEVGAGYVFLLDTATSQVIAQPLDGSLASVIFAADSESGQDRPMAIAMLSNGLLVLDAAGHFWIAFPGSPTTKLALNPGTGVAVTDIAVQNGDLYILDSTQSAVFRYAPTPGGYEDAPMVYLAAPELKQAVRLLVDTEVVTITAEGTVNRFAGGAALALSQAGIDRKVVVTGQPRSFDGGSSLAIPDPANKRIVVLRRDGTFDRQYQHDAFVGLQAMALGPEEGYVFSGGQVRRISW